MRKSVRNLVTIIGICLFLGTVTGCGEEQQLEETMQEASELVTNMDGKMVQMEKQLKRAKKQTKKMKKANETLAEKLTESETRTELLTQKLEEAEIRIAELTQKIEDANSLVVKLPEPTEEPTNLEGEGSDLAINFYGDTANQKRYEIPYYDTLEEAIAYENTTIIEVDLEKYNMLMFEKGFPCADEDPDNVNWRNIIEVSPFSSLFSEEEEEFWIDRYEMKMVESDYGVTSAFYCDISELMKEDIVVTLTLEGLRNGEKFSEESYTKIHLVKKK